MFRRGGKKQGVRTASPLVSRPRCRRAARRRDQFGGLQEARGILRHAVQPDLEVQVRAGRAAGRADRRDALAAHHEVAFVHEHLRRVGVTRNQPVAVVDLDHFTILRVPARGDDLAARGGDDRRAGVGREVDAFVERLLPGERIDAVAEVRRKPAVDDRRQRRQELAVGRVLRRAAPRARPAGRSARRPGARASRAARRIRCTESLRDGSDDSAPPRAGSLRRLQRRQLLRLQSGDLGETLAEAVEAQHLRLQLAQAHRHRVEMALRRSPAS